MHRSTPQSGTGDRPSAADATRVFISYTHDSAPHRRRVLELANRLRADGVDAEIDQFEEAPPEGWPNWMATQIRRAKYVVVVCTAAYHRRVTGQESGSVGLGARWEGGLITQALYETGGQNDKFIPVVFETADLAEIPDFLRHTTYYDLSDPTQYETLYARMTAQRQTTRPPLGKIRQLPAASNVGPNQEVAPSGAAATEIRAPLGAMRADVRSVPDGRDAPTASESGREQPAPALVLLRTPAGRMYFLPLVSAEVRDTITLTVQYGTGEDRAYLESLTAGRMSQTILDVAFETTAIRGPLRSVVRKVASGQDQFVLTLSPDERTRPAGVDMATSGYTADDIARLRARRIVLGEQPAADPKPAWGRSQADSMLETLVRGLQSPIPVDHSPLPDLYASFEKHDSERFLAAAKLTAVLWLIVTGTVAHIVELNMRFAGPRTLAVRFRGVRAKVYSNQDPPVITVEGECVLD
jgi:hypothetical protein